MRTFEKFIRTVGNWGTVMGAIVLLAIALLISAIVIFRAIHISMAGTFDLVGTMVIVAIAFAMVFGQLNDSHLRADLAIERITGRLRHAMESFSGAISLFYWGIILVASALQMWKKWGVGEQTDLLNVPIAPFRGVWVFTLVLMVILLILKLVHQVKLLITGGEER
jgi:TRAP-type C4-dicarboxylate transport system permease small subunit